MTNHMVAISWDANVDGTKTETVLLGVIPVPCREVPDLRVVDWPELVDELRRRITFDIAELGLALLNDVMTRLAQPWDGA